MQFHLKYFVISTIMFSLATVMMLSFAYAQYGDVPSVPQMKEISGNYVNDNAGVRITFPASWSGVEMQTSQGTVVMVSPGGMSSGAQPTQVMNLVISDKTKVKEAPTDPTQGKSKCDTPTVKSITVSGSDGTETTMTCTDDTGKKTKAKIVSAQTEERWISVMFMAPIAEFDGSVGKFDDAIKTLSILNVMASANPQEETPSNIYLKPITMSVMVGGKDIDVSMQSSSVINDLTVGEENKTVSFSASGNSHGTTSISLGSVLKGPYAVMLDGQVTQDYNMTDAQTLELTYGSGIHNVSISGTQVVPEFPLGVAGLIVILVGTIAIIGRTKIFGKIKY